VSILNISSFRSGSFKSFLGMVKCVIQVQTGVLQTGAQHGQMQEGTTPNWNFCIISKHSSQFEWEPAEPQAFHKNRPIGASRPILAGSLSTRQTPCFWGEKPAGADKMSESESKPGKALSLHRHFSAREARDPSRWERAAPDARQIRGHHMNIRRPIFSITKMNSNPTC